VAVLGVTSVAIELAVLSRYVAAGVRLAAIRQG
jgi:hypothetical protein